MKFAKIDRVKIPMDTVQYKIEQKIASHFCFQLFTQCLKMPKNVSLCNFFGAKIITIPRDFVHDWKK